MAGALDHHDGRAVQPPDARVDAFFLDAPPKYHEVVTFTLIAPRLAACGES